MLHVLLRLITAGLAGQAVVNIFAILGIAFHYVGHARAAAKALTFRAFLNHTFPAEIMISRWTYIDILYYAMSRVFGWFIVPIAGSATLFFASIVETGLRDEFGVAPMLPLNSVMVVTFLIVGVLARDFVSFYMHMMQHRIPLLWEFHKVHHAPETIIPVTGHRLHPLEQFFNLLGDALAFGTLVGVFVWLTHPGLDFLILCSVGIQVLISTLTFAPLRHSHIDLRLGWFEGFLLSPAHHRLHHSFEEPHLDKNFAAIFPFWDRFWCTIMTRRKFRRIVSDYRAVRARVIVPSSLVIFSRFEILSRRSRLRDGGRRYGQTRWPEKSPTEPTPRCDDQRRYLGNEWIAPTLQPDELYAGVACVDLSLDKNL